MKTLITSALAAAAILAGPASALAATYAYVNTNGEVRTVEAADPNTAIITAPGISTHSGVMLINDVSDQVVGDNVSGV